MRAVIKKILLLVGPLLIFLPFNNCAKSGFRTITDSMDLSSQSGPQYDGKNLYAIHCSACHGPLETSQKQGRTLSQIQAAIASQPAMKFLTTLTSTQVELISGALSQPSTPPPNTNPGKPTEFKALTTNRYMLKSVLAELFVADVGLDASDTAIVAVLDNLIVGHPEAFGGNCTRNDPGCSTVCGEFPTSECVGKLDTSMTANPTPVLSAISQGYLTRACEETLNIDKAVNNALSKVGLTSSQPPTDSDLVPVIQAFYRDKPFDGALVVQLMSVTTEARNKGYSSLDQWRFTLLPLCLSSATELL